MTERSSSSKTSSGGGLGSLWRLVIGLGDQGRGLAEDSLALLRLDMSAAVEDLGKAARQLAIAQVLLAVALAFIGLALAVLLQAVLPLWGALGLIGLVLALAGLAALGAARRSVESLRAHPQRTRRVLDALRAPDREAAE